MNSTDPARGPSPGQSPGPAPDTLAAAGATGLCASCRHTRVVTSAKGSSFLLCGLAKTDSRFARYPPQPRVECSGHAR